MATSWTTLQPIISRSVSGLVVLRRLRVMLTTTTADDEAIPSPTSKATLNSSPASGKGGGRQAGRDQDLQRRHDQ